MITLSSVKEYLRIDGGAEDALLQSLIAAAGAYMAGAIDDYAATYEADANFAALADMLQFAYIVETYRNRDALNDTRGNDKHFSTMFFSQMTQLQNWTVTGA
ncbi:MAG: phage head-tail connector protein [Schwartzia sp.]|nr:phage head-tail connector protein [Schwartzia sp. (in: firmicutes)]MBQ8698064.1 phage head-tail connector protein [Schwartzia sp. (in: firmicutes)]